jgi:tetratricopeptide (TPR) repeat protein
MKSNARKSFPAFQIFTLLAVFPAFGQSLAPVTDPGEKPSASAVVASPLSLEVTPGFSMPLGDSANYFKAGAGGDLGLGYRFLASAFSLLGGLDYSFIPDQASQSLSAVALRGGAEADLRIVGGVAAYVFGAGGGYYAAYNDFSKSSPGAYAAGGLGLRFSLGSSLSLKVGAQYQGYFGLYQGLSLGAGVSIPLGNLGGSVDIESVQFEPAFPVFFKHYDDHPVGSLELQSKLKVPATDVKVSVYVKEYMDAPKTMEVPGTLKAGDGEKVDLYALFNDKLLGITEGTKVAAEITVDYRVEGKGYENRQVQTLSLLGRNAMTWDDNRKAAAFVTAKEPQVLDFARSVTSYIHAKETRSIADTLQSAIALHEAIDLYGINYTPNPVTPYSEASKKKDVVDFLQFPRETFKYKAGDCSDLSILYASLLQAVGIDAAFITVPGHIFVAVNTGLPSDKAPDALVAKGMFIDQGGKAWIPVEITLRRQGFLKAWELGSKEWSESQAAGQAGFYPVQEAWAAYQPAGLPGSGDAISLPQSDQILVAYQREVQKCIDASVGPRRAELEAQAASGKNVAALNALGVLYAKYGDSGKAEAAFKKALAVKGYLPAMINLGNLYYQKGDWAQALKQYDQANEVAPNTPRIVLALAKSNRELKNYAVAQSGYEKLKKLDPALASQFAYLASSDSGSRAADVASERSAVLWEGEE